MKLDERLLSSQRLDSIIPKVETSIEEVRSNLKTTEADLKSAVTTVSYSADGKKILSCGGDKVVKLWDAGSGDLIRTYKGHTGTVTSAAFSPGWRSRSRPIRRAAGPMPAGSGSFPQQRNLRQRRSRPPSFVPPSSTGFA